MYEGYSGVESGQTPELIGYPWDIQWISPGKVSCDHLSLSRDNKRYAWISLGYPWLSLDNIKCTRKRLELGQIRVPAEQRTPDDNIIINYY